MERNEHIRARYSCRKFKADEVSDELLLEILETARWAPSGLNNQPWRFILIRDPQIKEQVSHQTKPHYSSIIKNAPCCIAVFYDKDAGYNYVKDVQAIGAAIEHILLSIHNLRLGGVWLGEILNKKNEVERILEVPETLELMAVIALGYPDEKPKSRSRKNLSELVFLNKYGNSYYKK